MTGEGQVEIQPPAQVGPKLSLGVSRETGRLPTHPRWVTCTTHGCLFTAAFASFLSKTKGTPTRPRQYPFG